MRTFAIAACVAALVMGTVAANAFELVYNGNFDLTTGGHADGWYGPAADYTGDNGVLYGNSVWVGGLYDAIDWLAQDVDFGTMPGNAYFSANTFIASDDVAGYDFFRISVGPLTSGWLDATSYLDENLWMGDVSTLMGTGVQTVLFEVSNDSSLVTNMFVDNVSIVACPVPEPASMLAIGAGLVGLAARRRKK